MVEALKQVRGSMFRNAGWGERPREPACGGNPLKSQDTAREDARPTVLRVASCVLPADNCGSRVAHGRDGGPQIRESVSAKRAKRAKRAKIGGNGRFFSALEAADPTNLANFLTPRMHELATESGQRNETNDSFSG